MCGLVGVFGYLGLSEVDYFKQALHCDLVRGEDSTGIAVIDAKGDVETFKQALVPTDLLDMKRVDKAITHTKMGFIGHNRKATLGGVNAANAHPFTHDHITLAHNGTLDNKYELQISYKESPHFGTDSELVCWLIANYGFEEVVPKLEGAFALTWWDSNEKALYVVRNDERVFSYLALTDTFIWASEGGMLDWIAKRNKLNIKADGTMIESIKLKEGRVLRMKYDSVSKEVDLTYKNIKVQNSWDNYGVGNSKKWKNSYGGGTRYNSGGSNMMDSFNQENGLDFQNGDILYAYLSGVEDIPASNVKKTVFTLACHPYCDVSTYADVEGEQGEAFQLELSGVGKINDDYYLLAKSLKEKRQHVNNEDLEGEMNAWIELYSEAQIKKSLAEEDYGLPFLN